MTLGLSSADYLIILTGCIIWLLISIYEEKSARTIGGAGEEAVRNMLDEKPLALRWALLLMCLAMILVLGIYGPGYDASAFIYRGF